MARFVPELEGKVFPSAAERKVAARLRAGLDDRYVVMHSVGLARHARNAGPRLTLWLLVPKVCSAWRSRAAGCLVVMGCGPSSIAMIVRR